ncbi:hypothetical protein BJ138DRAFT_1118588 [Hygrophoropsis aurantiaca]|uniref:Uncharacterized protein n=1 Tax=Hygrophoropsis aurantiaca TaxID=72124 RepID=A0ACB7ZX89_9AGAM|nr:hypothetical protein BJ138DRAFT_1118588 [Hygrophoropsis aurantiaca]
MSIKDALIFRMSRPMSLVWLSAGIAMTKGTHTWRPGYLGLAIVTLVVSVLLISLTAGWTTLLDSTTMNVEFEMGGAELDISGSAFDILMGQATAQAQADKGLAYASGPLEFMNIGAIMSSFMAASAVNPGSTGVISGVRRIKRTCQPNAPGILWWLRFEGTYAPPFYTDLYNFKDGVQDDIFVDSYTSMPVPGPNQTVLPVPPPPGSSSASASGSATSASGSATTASHTTATTHTTASTSSSASAAPSQRTCSRSSNISAFSCWSRNTLSRRNNTSSGQDPEPAGASLAGRILAMTRHSRTCGGAGACGARCDSGFEWRPYDSGVEWRPYDSGDEFRAAWI